MTLPNVLTVIRILLTPVVLILFLLPGENSLLAASFVFLFAGFTDWLDGFYARKYNVISRWGQYMDPLADKFLVSGILIAFWLKSFVFGWMVWSMISRDILITALRSYALWKGKPVVTSQIAKIKTFAQMGTILYMLVYLDILEFRNPEPIKYVAYYFDIPGILFTLVTFLTIFSGIQYVYENRHLIFSSGSS